MSLLLHVQIAYGQQYASLLLSTIGGDDYIVVDDESLIYEGDVKDTSILLVEFNSGENVHLDFDIQSGFDVTDDFVVNLKDPLGGAYYGYRVSGGDIQIEDIDGIVPLGVSSAGGYMLEIVRCDTTIFYLHEGSIILCRELSSGNGFQLNGLVTVFDALDAGIDIAIESNIDCDYVCEQIEEQYLAIENFVEWREHVITVPQIRFKYVEKYAIAAENATVSCTLFRNSDGAQLLNTSLPNRYGINLHTLDLGVTLTDGDLYVFQVSGMNKGREYRIRIRYDE